MAIQILETNLESEQRITTKVEYNGKILTLISHARNDCLNESMTSPLHESFQDYSNLNELEEEEMLRFVHKIVRKMLLSTI